MTSKRNSLMVWPALLLWLLALPVHAAVEAGRILFARGTVAIVDQSDSARGAGVGSVFYEGDRVVTGNNSIAQLRLTDGALTALRANSNYHIERQRFDEANDVYEQAGRLVTGWMRSVTGTIGARRPGNVSQGTSVATIGIRGTVYQVIHVPEHGLPEFPNLEPGTYIYLEEGQIEISNDAGSRLVTPGQVVRVRGANVVPELAPDLAELFQSETITRSDSSGSDDFSIREVTDSISDQLANTVADQGGSGVPPPFERVGGMNISRFYSGGSDAESGGLSWAQTGNQRYVTQAEITQSGSGYRYRFTLNGGELPDCLSCRYSVLSSDGSIASEVFWGKWNSGQYGLEENFGGETYFPITAEGYWHYVFGSNLVFPDEVDRFGSSVLELGLTGSYRYNLVPGSGLFSSVDGGLLALSSGAVMVNLGQNLMRADLVFSGGLLSSQLEASGKGSIADFYESGLQLESNYDLNEYIYGSMTGGFVGDGAEGLLAGFNLDYSSDGSFATYLGTAVFQQGQPMPFGYGGLSVIDRGGVVDVGRVTTNNMLTFNFDSSTVVPYLVTYLGAGGEVTAIEAIAADTSGLTVDSRILQDEWENPLGTVVWGVWSSGDISLVSGGSPIAPASDWHFMISTNPMTLSQVSQLVGTYQYFYNGGTAITGSLGGLLEIDYGAITVDFGAMNMDVDIVFFDGSVFGQGGIAAFYSTGILLSGGASEIDMFGRISGEFVGPDGAGIISAIELETDDGSERFVGTAYFDRDNNPVSPFGAVSVFAGESFSTPRGTSFGSQAFVNFGPLGPVLLDAEFFSSGLGYTYYLNADSQQTPDVSSLGQAIVYIGVEDEIATEVYWGIWDQENYFAANNMLGPISQTGDWHYMIATNVLGESEVLGIGLSGSYSYGYVGGTELTEYLGGMTASIQGTSLIDVDFDNLFGANGIAVTLDIVGGGFGTMAGAGSITDLYTSGIGLSDALEPLVFGSINGAFAGQNAEAIISTVVLEYNTETYIGTALFEQFGP